MSEFFEEVLEKHECKSAKGNLAYDASTTKSLVGNWGFANLIVKFNHVCILCVVN